MREDSVLFVIKWRAAAFLRDAEDLAEGRRRPRVSVLLQH